MNPMIERLFNIEKLSELLDVKKKTIYDWVYKKQIPYYKAGRLLRFDYDDIQRWLTKKYSKPK
jgi:excisionase family DNA binding protein